jgi:AcrR family transcriptional regulator
MKKKTTSKRTAPSVPAPPAVAGTRERILEAAEELFSSSGPHGVSLREVVDVAHVNIAAVNYYFGSKDKLFDEVVARSIGRLAAGLTAAMQEATRAHPGGLRLEDVIATYLRGGLGSEPKAYLRLRTWMALVDAERAAELLALHFDPIMRQYIGALGDVLPKLSTIELGWRLYLITAALLFTAFDANRLETLTEGKARSTDVETVIANLVPLLADGIRQQKTPPRKARPVRRAKTRGAAG